MNHENLISQLMDDFEASVNTLHRSQKYLSKVWLQSRILHRELEREYGSEKFITRDYPEAGRVLLAHKKLNFSGYIADHNHNGARMYYETNREMIEKERRGEVRDPQGSAKAFVQWVEVGGYLGDEVE